MSQRFRSKEQCYLDVTIKTTRRTFHPQVKFQGKWCYLPDDSTLSKLVEAPDAMTATELAIKAVRELDSKKAICRTCNGKKKVPTTGSAMYWPDKFPNELKDCPECN